MIHRRSLVLPCLVALIVFWACAPWTHVSAETTTPFANDAIQTPGITAAADDTTVAPPVIDPNTLGNIDQGVSVAPLTASLPAPVSEFLLIGHMGAPHERIENTLPRFERALDLGANAIETDLSLTKDGVLVHWHDWNPNDMVAKFRQLGRQGLLYRPHCPGLFTKWRKPVPELTLAELRANFGYVRTIYGVGTRQPRSTTTILTFDEFATWAAGQPKLRRIFLDVKIPKDRTAFVEPFFTTALRVLKEHGIDDRAVFMVPQETILKAAKPFFGSDTQAVLDWDQELPAGIIIHPDKFSAATKSIAAGISYASVGRPVATIVGYSIFRKIIVRDLERQKKHNRALPATPLTGYIAWTIDKPDEMRELIKLGVQGILTNRPELLRAATLQP